MRTPRINPDFPGFGLPHRGRRRHHGDFGPDESPRGRRGGPGGFGPPGFGPGGFGPGAFPPDGIDPDDLEEFGPGGFGPPAGGRFGPGPFAGPRGPRHRGRGGPRRAGRGDVRLAVLSLLAETPSNGYGLIKAIAAKTGDAWRPSPGSVYPTLQQLVDEGLVDATGDGRGTEYTLSDAGRTYVVENAEQIARTWAATPGQSPTDIAFHESVTKLRGAIQQLRHTASDEQRAAATEKLDDLRRALYLILAD